MICVSNTVTGNSSHTGFSKSLCEPFVKRLHSTLCLIICLIHIVYIEISQRHSIVLLVSLAFGGFWVLLLSEVIKEQQNLLRASVVKSLQFQVLKC